MIKLKDILEAKTMREGVFSKIDMKMIMNILKKERYEFHIAKGNKVTGVKTINIPAKRPGGPEKDWGHMSVHSNGEIKGSNSWSTKIKYAKNIISHLKAFIDAQEKLHESINEGPSVISMKESEKVWDALVKKFSDNKNDSIEYLNKDRTYRNMAIKAIFTATKF